MITITFLVLILAFSIYCFNDRKAMQRYMFHPYSIYHNNEHYRFLTHAFIHGDYVHLIFNCIALYSVGLFLEEGFFGDERFFDPRLGKLYYILLFTGGIYAASLTEYFRNRKDSSYSSLGASGAISSIIFCYIMIQPLSILSIFFIRMPGWIFGALLLGISFFLIRRKKSGKYSDNISHESHFWGAIYGIVFIAVVKPVVVKYFFLQVKGVFGL
jgi:membrane associated rhomboid family serine protease